jgi:glycosyltransferase involved in cell wall biosynthesis
MPRPEPGRRAVNRVLFLSGEPATPGHHYRVTRTALACAELGWRHSVIEAPFRRVSVLASLLRPPDVVVIWRATWRPALEAAVKAWRKRGATILCDVDDLIFDPLLADPMMIDGIRSMGLVSVDVSRTFAAMRRTIMLADECLAPTDPLADALRTCGRPVTVLPNTFDHAIHRTGREAVRRRRAAPGDGLVRIGYASGSRTHQRDFAVAADALAAVMRGRPACRLVLFREPRRGTPLLDVHEFPSLAGLESRIEWRPLVPLERLPEELARFDINLAPLEVGNVFCEAKSELKYFEAALVGVPTIASPTSPLRKAISHDETGLLATTPTEWRDRLDRLVVDAALRTRLGQAAHNHVLRYYDPDSHRERVRALLDRLMRARATPAVEQAHGGESPSRSCR